MGQFEIWHLDTVAPARYDDSRMAERRKQRPRDPLALAKMIGDIAAGQTSDTEPDTRNQAAVELGRLGGKKGGEARADKMTPAQRREIAQKARKNAGLNRRELIADAASALLSRDGGGGIRTHEPLQRPAILKKRCVQPLCYGPVCSNLFQFF